MLSVLIATRNRAASLRRTLESLGRMVPPEGGWEIVVVDNGSTDDTHDTVARFAAAAPMPVRHVVEPVQGKSVALNTGISRAEGDILAFTDDDVVVDPGWARALARAAAQTGRLGAGGKIDAEWTVQPPHWLATEGPHRPMTVVAFDAGDTTGDLTAPPFGPNMAFRRAAFERYGLFRTDLGPGPGRYLPGQDTEFGRRLMRAGERLAWAPDAVVRHVHQTEKMTKKYIASWYFAYGRMATRTGALPAGTVRYVGVPRFLVRRLVEDVRRWAATTEPAPRFHYGAEACRTAGEIVEALLGGARS